MEKDRQPDHVVHQDKDLRITDAHPWDVARKLVSGGAPKREFSKSDDEDDDGAIRHSSI